MMRLCERSEKEGRVGGFQENVGQRFGPERIPGRRGKGIEHVCEAE